jgi:hypothetical protein
VVRHEAVINRTEDLNVKVCEEAVTLKISIVRAVWYWARERQFWFKTIARYCDAAITCGRDNRRGNEGHRLAAALGARLSRWRCA